MSDLIVVLFRFESEAAACEALPDLRARDSLDGRDVWRAPAGGQIDVPGVITRVTAPAVLDGDGVVTTPPATVARAGWHVNLTVAGEAAARAYENHAGALAAAWFDADRDPRVLFGSWPALPARLPAGMAPVS